MSKISFEVSWQSWRDLESRAWRPRRGKGLQVSRDLLKALPDGIKMYSSEGERRNINDRGDCLMLQSKMRKKQMYQHG